MSEYTIRTATPDDANEILGIYSCYVKETAITFEYAVPSLKDFTERIRSTLEHYPYIVCLKEDRILGYAYAGTFHARPAYDWSVETSIYVHKDHRGQGIGKLLYENLESLLKRMNITNANACIAYTGQKDKHLNNDSVTFHEHLGYRSSGHFHKCGYKFDTWYDMVWMEKHIGSHSVPAEKVVWFSELRSKQD